MLTDDCLTTCPTCRGSGWKAEDPAVDWFPAPKCGTCHGNGYVAEEPRD